MSGDAIRRDVMRAAQSGFTLIELLVSLMILALILSFLPGTLRVGQRIWEIDQTIDERAALSAFRRFVEQRLAETMPIYLRDATGAAAIEFTGEPDRLAFVAPAEAGPGAGGVYRFVLANGADRVRPVTLAQSIYRLPPAIRSDEEGARTVHRPKAAIAGLRLRYFGAAAPQQPKQWMDTWPRTDALPDLAEIVFIPRNDMAKMERSVVPLRLKPAS